MKNKLIALRYAKAIFELIDKNNFSMVIEDIKKLDDLKDYEVKILELPASPLLSRKQKEEIVKEISNCLSLDKLWNQIFGILLDKKRFSILLDITEELFHLILKEQNKQCVTVYFARETDKKSIEKIEEYIKSVLKTDLEVKIKVDPLIVGGFVAETNSMRFDGSIHYNLSRFKTMLNDI